MLKMDHNTQSEQLNKYKARNAQLESIINALYDDLDQQKEQI